jgi:hypothetical protein
MSERRGTNFMEARARQLAAEKEGQTARLNSRGGGGTSDGVEPSERLAKLEVSVNWIKVIGTIMVTVMLGGFALLTTLIVSGTARLDGRIDSLSAKVDAIPRQLSEEFRAMRAEMSAQTAAIASSITATKQVQPQIVVLPAPGAAPKP